MKGRTLCTGAPGSFPDPELHLVHLHPMHISGILF